MATGDTTDGGMTDALEPTSTAPRRAPGVMLHRLSGPLSALLACGIARLDEDVVDLFLDAREAAEGGMVTIAMRVPVRCSACAASAPSCAACGGEGSVEELFAAWLAVRPGVRAGTILEPSAQLPRVLRPVRFRVHPPAP